MAVAHETATREGRLSVGHQAPSDGVEGESARDLQERFRGTMAAVASSVSIVTSHFDDRPHGATVSAFASLSMEPPMVLVSLDQHSGLLKMIQEAGVFGLNILSTEQGGLAMSFAKKGADKFASVEWSLEHGVPRLPAALGWLACEVSDAVAAGDHVVLIGRVKEAANGEGKPLTYHLRSMGTHVPI